ncbi:toxin TumE [Thermodesulfobacteriota bacterium]
MPDDTVIKYLSNVETAIRNLESGYVERYEEEILTLERANLRFRVRFQNGYMLEWNEAVTVESGNLNHLSYRYHFQDENNNLIFRYDNTPHFPHLESFPHHKHLPGSVVAIHRPSAFQILEDVRRYLT